MAKTAPRKFKRIKVAVKKTITARYDDLKEWRMDPKAYILIRVNRPRRRIEVGIVNPKTHTVHTQVNGKDAREIYHSVAKKRMLSFPEHYAYLGRELMKAQIALHMGLNYVQDSPLPLPNLKRDAF